MTNYLKKAIISCCFFIINFAIHSQNTTQYTFHILRFGDSVRVESCIPLEQYSERLMLPNRQQTNLRQIYDFIPIYIIGSKWINDCLIINWTNIPNDEIIGNIKEITILRDDQIILSE